MKSTHIRNAKRWAMLAKVALVVLVLLFVVFSVIYGTPSLAGGAGEGPLSFPTWVVTIRNSISALIGLLAVVMVIAGGIVYATSQGNPNQIGVARDIIVSAIAGAALYALASMLLGGPGASELGQGLISRFFPPS